MEGFDPWLHTIGDVVSVLAISSCLFLKVPQIRQIQKTSSAEGIYPQAIILEITSYSIMMLYSYTNDYAILTYMEYPIVLVQSYALLYLVLKYSKLLHKPIVPVGTFIYLSILFGFMGGLTPKYILSYVVPFCTPFNAFAKFAYIYGIIKVGNADAVSLTTWIISIATNGARIFTVYLDSRDAKLLFNFTFSMCLSIGVLSTALYYKCPVGQRARPTTSQTRRSVRHEHND